MTTLTQAVGAPAAQIRNALVRFGRGAAAAFAMLDAAVRVASALERHQNPHPADMQTLGLKGPLPRFR